LTAKLRCPLRLVKAATQRRVSGQHFVSSLPELVARLLRELHTAQCPHSLRKQYHSQCGGWWMVSPPRYASVSVACGTHCGARHGCTAQAFEITVTLRLHPQSGHYAEDPGVGQNRACCFRIPSHVCSMHRGGRASRQRRMHGGCNSCRSCDTATCQRPDLPARDIAALLPSVAHKKPVLVMAEVPCSGGV